MDHEKRYEGNVSCNQLDLLFGTFLGGLQACTMLGSGAEKTRRASSVAEAAANASMIYEEEEEVWALGNEVGPCPDAVFFPLQTYLHLETGVTVTPD